MKWLFMSGLLAVPLFACSQPQKLEVSRAWTRASAGDANTAALFMTIESSSDDRLTGASTPIAGKTDLMTMSGGATMKMVYLSGIDIPAGQPVSLNPTGLHVWLAQLSRPLKAGERIPLSLRFAKAGERRVMVPVIAPSAVPPG